MKQLIYITFFAILLTGCATAKQTAQRKSEREAKELIEFANKYIGTHYVAGGTTPKGFDCSGFVQYSFKNSIGYSLPRTTKEQAKIGTEVKKKKLKQGDLVFFKGKNDKSKDIGHVGIVTKANKGEFYFIHAASSGVRVDNSKSSYYKTRYIKARRIIGSQ
ncbi:MAG: C40 family peptidase [Dysgonamonadaceae bacterium]|jgi:cell wall-associated NlpC family hydrolase|nr:C40 family peptidase [Dysgonamonadaceae bacterium]